MVADSSIAATLLRLVASSSGAPQAHHPVQAVVEVLWQVLGSVQLLQQLVQQFFCPLCCFFSAVYAAPVSSLFAAKEGACALLEHPEGL